MYDIVTTGGIREVVSLLTNTYLVVFFLFFFSYLLTLIIIVVFTGDTRYFILAVHGVCDPYLLTLIVIVVFTGDTRYFILAVHGICEGFVLPMLGPFLRVFSGLGIAACTAPLWRTRRPRSRHISMMNICRLLRG